MKASTLIRLSLSGLLVYGVYLETGWVTALAIFLLILGTEGKNFIEYANKIKMGK